MKTYTISRLGHQGDGIAEGPLYAPMTLPNEVVTGTPDGTTLRDVRIVTPSPDRIAAPCRHFKSCGGCKLQHARDEFIAEWKVDVVRQALAAHGIETQMRDCLTSPPQTRRRASFAAKRTKKGAMVGFHAQASDTIIEIPDCKLIDPRLKSAMPIVERIAVIGASRKGVLAVTVTDTQNGPDIAVTGGKEADTETRLLLAQECEASKVARLAWDGDVIALREPPYQTFGRAKVVPPSGAFLQATPEGERDLVETVREIVGNAQNIADLFCGSGTFALPLAENAQVHAVEGDAQMIAALDAGWRMASGLKRVSTEARDLFRRPLLPDELAKYDAVVIDPPRAGAEAQSQQLAQSAVRQIAYVSCNPVTFARDAKLLLAGGYKLDWVQTVDQFRWSNHIELVSKFTKS